MLILWDKKWKFKSTITRNIICNLTLKVVEIPVLATIQFQNKNQEKAY